MHSLFALLKFGTFHVALQQGHRDVNENTPMQSQIVEVLVDIPRVNL